MGVKRKDVLFALARLANEIGVSVGRISPAIEHLVGRSLAFRGLSIQRVTAVGQALMTQVRTPAPCQTASRA